MYQEYIRLGITNFLLLAHVDEIFYVAKSNEKFKRLGKRLIGTYIIRNKHRKYENTLAQIIGLDIWRSKSFSPEE